MQQLFRGMLSPERTLLFFLTAGTTIMSATTVAVFPIRQDTISVVKSRLSHTLEDFNNTFFVQGSGFYSPPWLCELLFPGRGLISLTLVLSTIIQDKSHLHTIRRMTEISI
jgi:hypothetical protein